MNLRSARIVLILLFGLIFSSTALALCTKDFRINPVSNQTLFEGKPYLLKLTAIPEGNVTYFANQFEPSIFSWRMSKNGIINFTPGKTDAGVHYVILTAVDQDLCIDYKAFYITIFVKPTIYDYSPKNRNMSANAGEFITFKIYGNSSSGGLNYLWYVDGALKSSLQSFAFKVFSNKSIYTILGKIADMHNLSSEQTWTVNVRNANLPLELVQNIPGESWKVGTQSTPYNLNDYFKDPEGKKLTFSHRPVASENKNITIAIDGNGNVILISEENYVGYSEVRFVANDGEFSAESNPVKFTVVSAEPELLVQNSQNATCIEKLICSEWSSCLLAGIQTMSCMDLNNCSAAGKTIIKTQKCGYKPSCEDGVQNQDEDAVDCGGVCQPCATCFDGIKNQDEEDVDCGGVCQPCPDCFDKIQNFGETDVDCGGFYCKKRCAAGQRCIRNSNCESSYCYNEICLEATCYDKIRNQGEEDVDCGGACKPCPTCFDGIKNQGEEDVDCGGTCPKKCATCFDGIKNQNEKGIDCGDVCNKSCFNFKRALLGILLIVLSISLVFFILFLRKNRDRLLWVIRFNRIMRKFRYGKYDKLNKETFDEVFFSLETLEKEIWSSTETKLGTDKVQNNILNFYRKALGLQDKFSDSDVYNTIYQLKIPSMSRLILKLFYKEISSYTSDAVLFSLELRLLIRRAKMVFEELKKDLL